MDSILTYTYAITRDGQEILSPSPGAMHNAQEARFHPIFDRPMSLGTRVHQLAMYVVFEGPLQMLADSPSNCLDEPQCLSFLSRVSTVWDETRVLSGQVGDWIAEARRTGNEWYVAAMTDWDARDLTLDLSFLGTGPWQMERFSDGANAHRFAEDFRRVDGAYDASSPLHIHLAPGGGWVGWIRPAGG